MPFLMTEASSCYVLCNQNRKYLNPIENVKIKLKSDFIFYFLFQSETTQQSEKSNCDYPVNVF